MTPPIERGTRRALARLRSPERRPAPCPSPLAPGTGRFGPNPWLMIQPCQDVPYRPVSPC